MARFCNLCGRGPTPGATRSHSNIKTKRTLFVNLQRKTIAGLKLKLCTRCIKTGNKTA